MKLFPDQRDEVCCSNCLKGYPQSGLPYRCPVCEGVYDYPRLPDYDIDQIDRAQPGIWRFRHALGLPETAPVVTIGEGCTPLVWRYLFGRRIAFKLEYLNPTGSYKDRGSAALVSFLLARGVSEAVEDSSGNAGASFAAYAAAGGLNPRIFIPELTSGPKRVQIEAYGAEVVLVPGSRQAAAEAVLDAVSDGAIYGSHGYMAQGLAGYATIAYELYEQLGGAPGSVVMPVGQAGLLLGVGRGFQSLQRAGVIERVPALFGVQALACAPLWTAYKYGAEALANVSEGETIAEGVRILKPLRGEAALCLVRASGGGFISVEEQKILPGRKELARSGFYVEPTSALVWDALVQLENQLIDPVVVILTGNGLKAT